MNYHSKINSEKIKMKMKMKKKERKNDKNTRKKSEYKRSLKIMIHLIWDNVCFEILSFFDYYLKAII